MLPWIPIGIVAAAAATAAYAVFVERVRYRLNRYRLDILPASAPARLEVLHLSDLHMLRGDRRMTRFLAGLPPADITIITGDIVGEPQAVEATVRALRPTRGRLASFFVLGSNDLFAPRPVNYLRYLAPTHRRHRRKTHRRGRAGDLVRMLEADGWVHLKNRKHDAGPSLEVVGLDDPHIHRGDLRVAPRTAPEAFGLAVVHAPDPAPELVALGYDLVVAGHTHGGQVNLPFLGALVTNSSIPPRMASGLFKLGDAFVHISPGLGTSKYAPFRLFCPPEATMLELGPAPAAHRSPVSPRPEPRS